MKVLVATWGNPLTWKTGKYYINNMYIESKTTYIPLFKSLNPDKGIIIVQNSLYPIFNVWNESSLKGKIIEILKEFGAGGDILSKTTIIITLSSGIYYNNPKNPKIKVTYEANFYDILLNLLIQLYFELKEAREVFLDLTHGINYFPTITLLALSYLKKILNFKLKVFNSTPIFNDGDRSVILDLGEIEIEGKLKINKMELESINREIRKVLREKLGKFNIRYGYKLIVAYQYGLIFPLIKYSGFHFNEELLREFIPTQIKENDIFKIKRLFDSEKLLKYILVILYALNIAKEFNKYKELKLEDLKDIKNKISNPVAKKLIENEYQIIKMFYDINEQAFLGKEKILYKEAQKMLEGLEEYRRRNLSEIRNYFAHVSILWHNTLLTKDRKILQKEDIEYIDEINEIEL